MCPVFVYPVYGTSHTVNYLSVFFRIWSACCSLWVLLKINCSGSGKMARQLRALVALAGTLIWFPEPTWWLTNIWNSSSRRLDASFRSWQALYTHSTQTFMQTKHPYALKKKTTKQTSNLFFNWLFKILSLGVSIAHPTKHRNKGPSLALFCALICKNRFLFEFDFCCCWTLNS